MIKNNYTAILSGNILSIITGVRNTITNRFRLRGIYAINTATRQGWFMYTADEFKNSIRHINAVATKSWAGWDVLRLGTFVNNEIYTQLLNRLK